MWRGAREQRVRRAERKDGGGRAGLFKLVLEQEVNTMNTRLEMMANLDVRIMRSCTNCAAHQLFGPK